jgi:hypothetical protein
MLRNLHSSDHNPEVNWEPRSEVNVVGTPNREIQWTIRAFATSTVFVEAKGMASGHLVVLSMIVNKCVQLSTEGGKGPTRSTWMWENLMPGIVIFCGWT